MPQHNVLPAPSDPGMMTANGSNSSHPNIPISPLLFRARIIHNQIDKVGSRAGDASELSSMDPPPAHDLGSLTTEVNELSPPTVPEGHLLSLPRELRDYIFDPLLRAGSVAILRTSKQIHDEAKEHLFHEAVFRVKMGFTGGRVNSFPTNWKFFERFHFRIFLGTPNTLPQQPAFRLFDRFTDLDGTNVKRECLISIEYGADWGVLRPGYPSSLPKKLACFNTFTTVVVEFMRHPGDCSPVLRVTVDTKDMMADKWWLWEKKLKHELGTGRLDIGNCEGARLVFHPLEYHSSLVGKGAGISEKD